MSRAIPLSVAVVSAAVLAYEVLLVRLFSIVSWHHFAYMIISIALLGFGASGSVLTLMRPYLSRRFTATFATCAVLFSATAVLSFSFAMRLPFNPLAIVWDGHQLLWLGFSYLFFILPFFFGGGAIGLAFSRYPNVIGRLYAFDLVGAGIGALGVIGVLFALSPKTTLQLVAALGLASAGLILLSASGRWTARLAAGFGAASLLVAIWLPAGLTDPHPYVSQYKGLQMALRVPDARIVEERSSPLGLLSVVASPTIPFRHAPGLSLNNVTEPPVQLGVFTDADSISAITHFEGDLGPLNYLDFTTSALPYHLLDKPEVLILGAGGGEQVLLALYHHVPEIDAIEFNPQMIDLVANRYADFAGDIYNRLNVNVSLGEARSFVKRTKKRYDLIQIPLLYSFGAAAAGTLSLHENYTYTVEAIKDYLARLKPGGLVSITLWVKLPPRDSLKLFATAVEALEELGVSPDDRLALIRSWKTATLLIKNGAFTPAQLVVLEEFTSSRSFDLAYYPGITSGEANRYTILERPHYFSAATALLGPRSEEFVESYKFEIGPATDDKPYFYDFFKWRFLPELWSLRKQGAAAMLDMGYLVLFATLLQAFVLSLLLILAPLVIKRGRFGGNVPKVGTSLYFLTLGLAFLFIEIAFIQRFTLFLGHPLYAVAVVLAGFLVFAGVGSAISPVLERRFAGPGRRRLGALETAIIAIGAVAVLYLVVLPPLFDALIALPDPVKIFISLVLIAPLACFMGMPFPLGISRIAQESLDLVPWAWGINGCASVVAAILATVLAMHFGFSAVVLIAVLLYLITPFLLPGKQEHKLQS